MSTSKAEYARKWRCRTRQSRRVDTLISGYLTVKYPAIHAEIMTFYETLNNKYPTKDNLTKTIEYRLWKSDQRMDSTTTPESEQATNSTIPEPEQATNSTTPEPEQAMNSTTPEPEQPTNSTTPEPEQAMNSTTPEPEQAMNSTTPEPEQPTNSTTPEPEQAMNSTTPEPEQPTNSTTPDPEQATIQAGQATEAQYDFGLDPMILDDLVDELNKDDEIRALLNGPFNFELSDW